MDYWKGISFECKPASPIVLIAQVQVLRGHELPLIWTLTTGFCYVYVPPPSPILPHPGLVHAHRLIDWCACAGEPVKVVTTKLFFVFKTERREVFSAVTLGAELFRGRLPCSVKVLQGTRRTIKQSFFFFFFYGSFCNGRSRVTPLFWKIRRLLLFTLFIISSGLWQMHASRIVIQYFCWSSFSSFYLVVVIWSGRGHCRSTPNATRWDWFLGRQLVYPMETHQWK